MLATSSIKLSPRVQTIWLKIFLVLFSFSSIACNHNFFLVSEAESKASTPPKNSGNGHGYEGKTYIARGECNYSTDSIKSILILNFDAKKAWLIKENCQDLFPAKELNFQSVKMYVPNQDQVHYEGVNFQDLATDTGTTKTMFNTPGTHSFTVPADSRASNVTILITLVGAGGGGGQNGAVKYIDGGQPVSPDHGGGGGGGGASGSLQQIQLTVPPLTEINVVVAGAGIISGQGTASCVEFQPATPSKYCAQGGLAGGNGHDLLVNQALVPSGSAEGGVGGSPVANSVVDGLYLVISNLIGTVGKSGIGTKILSGLPTAGGAGGDGFFVGSAVCGRGSDGNAPTNAATRLNTDSNGCVLFEVLQ